MTLIWQRAPRRGLGAIHISVLASRVSQVPRTVDEEQVSSSILPLIRKVPDDPIDVLAGWHEQVHCLKLGLGFAMIGNGFDSWLPNIFMVK
jgi:hypothetical protein